MAKEIKDEVKGFFKDGGEAVVYADFPVAVRVGVDTLNSINAPHPAHADKIHGKVLFYSGLEIRFLYADQRGGSPKKVVIPITAIKNLILE